MEKQEADGIEKERWKGKKSFLMSSNISNLQSTIFSSSCVMGKKSFEVRESIICAAKEWQADQDLFLSYNTFWKFICTLYLVEY